MILFFFFKEFNPIKMATNLFGTVKGGIDKIPFPWKS